MSPMPQVQGLVEALRAEALRLALRRACRPAPDIRIRAGDAAASFPLLVAAAGARWCSVAAAVCPAGHCVAQLVAPRPGPAGHCLRSSRLVAWQRLALRRDHLAARAAGARPAGGAPWRAGCGFIVATASQTRCALPAHGAAGRGADCCWCCSGRRSYRLWLVERECRACHAGCAARRLGRGSSGSTPACVRLQNNGLHRTFPVRPGLSTLHAGLPPGGGA